MPLRKNVRKEKLYALARAEFGSRWHMVSKATRKERLRQVREKQASNREPASGTNPASTAITDIWGVLSSAVKKQTQGTPLTWEQCEAMNEAMYDMLDADEYM